MALNNLKSNHSASLDLKGSTISSVWTKVIYRDSRSAWTSGSLTNAVPQQIKLKADDKEIQYIIAQQVRKQVSFWQQCRDNCSAECRVTDPSFWMILMSRKSTFVSLAGSMTRSTASTQIGDSILEYCDTTWQHHYDTAQNQQTTQCQTHHRGYSTGILCKLHLLTFSVN